MITTHRLIQSLNNLATASEDSHPEIAGILLVLSALSQRPNKAELQALFLFSCEIAERELATMDKEEAAVSN